MLVTHCWRPDTLGPHKQHDHLYHFRPPSYAGSPGRTSWTILLKPQSHSQRGVGSMVFSFFLSSALHCGHPHFSFSSSLFVLVAQELGPSLKRHHTHSPTTGLVDHSLVGCCCCCGCATTAPTKFVLLLKLLWSVCVQIALCSYMYLNTGVSISENHALTAECFCSDPCATE